MAEPGLEMASDAKKIGVLKLCASDSRGIENVTIKDLIERERKWLEGAQNEKDRLFAQEQLDVLESFSEEDRGLRASSVLERLEGVQ